MFLRNSSFCITNAPSRITSSSMLFIAIPVPPVPKAAPSVIVSDSLSLSVPLTSLRAVPLKVRIEPLDSRLRVPISLISPTNS